MVGGKSRPGLAERGQGWEDNKQEVSGGSHRPQGQGTSSFPTWP